MNAFLAIALLAVLAIAGCLATGGQGIWAIPLVIISAGCGRLFVRSAGDRRYAVADARHPDKV